jgi:hypothetical protein
MKSETQKGAVILGMGILLLAWIHTSGCAAVKRNAVGYTKPDTPVELNATTLQFNYTTPASSNYFRTAYAAAKTNSQPFGDQQAVRNQIIDELMALIDQDFHKFEFNLENFNNGRNLVASLASLGLTTAATVVGGAETKTILSAIAGGVIGANLAVDKVIFKELAIQAIRNQMRTMRAQKAPIIKTSKQLTVSEYGLNATLADIIDYYYCGYVYRALDELLLQSGANLQQARTNYQATTLETVRQMHSLSNVTNTASTNHPSSTSTNHP